LARAGRAERLTADAAQLLLALAEQVERLEVLLCSKISAK
jgi:hypothetical protein